MGAHHHHHHHHPHELEANDLASLKRIRLAFILNMTFALIELIGGLWTGSFAIVADAIHDFGDSLSLALALFLQKKSTLGPSSKLTYGYRRYSVLSSLVSGGIIVLGSWLVIIEAVPRLIHPDSIPHAKGMIALAFLGLCVNGFAAFGLSKGHTHNEKILSWHLIEDFLGWLAVLAGAVFIYFYQVPWIDPLLAIGIAIFVQWNVVKNLKDPLGIILQHVPETMDLREIKTAIESVKGVDNIVELHAWSLDGLQHVLTTRLHVDQGVVFNDLKQEIREILRAKGFQFVTIEVGFHVDEPHEDCHVEKGVERKKVVFKPVVDSHSHTCEDHEH
jgi:cobalt-zinc-cadmium efflux system protein